MPRSFELRRLTRDVPNPAFDRRNRYGAAAIATFTEGTLLRYYPRGTRDFDLESVTLLRPGGDTVHAPYAACTALHEASAPAKPQTPAEALLVVDFPSHCSDDVLRRLHQMGAVTLDQIIAAAQAEINATNSQEN